SGCCVRGPEEARWSVVRGLGRVADPAVIPLLVDTLANAPQAYLRSEAADALGKQKDPAAVGPLLAALQAPGFCVGQRVVMALGEIGDRRAVAPLCALFQNVTLTPSLNECWLQQAAAAALARLGDPRAVEPLLVTVAQHSDVLVKVAAIQALGQLGDARALHSLLAVLRDPDPNMRRAAAEALGLLGDPHAIAPLLSLLDDQDTQVGQVQVSLVQALGRLSAHQAFDHLLDLLHSTDPVLLAAVTEA